MTPIETSSGLGAPELSARDPIRDR